MICREAPELGAYVLGALDPEGRRRVGEHAAGCAECAAELAGFRRLPALLDRVPAEDLEPVLVTPSPELFDRVAAAVQVRPAPARPVRRLLLAAAAAVVVLAAGAGITVWLQNDQGRTWTASAGGIQLAVTASEARDGSALDVTVAGLEVGQDCRLVVLDREGDRHPAGEWTVKYAGAASWRGWTAVAPSSLSEIVLLGDDGRELVRVRV